MRYLALVCLLVATVGVQRADTQSQPLRIERIDFGRTFGSTVVSSSAKAVNDRGVVTGYIERRDGTRAVYTWSRARGFRTHVEEAFPNDINDRGRIVGLRACEGGSCWPSGFEWSASTGMRDLGDFLPEAINEKGDVAGSCFARQTACARIAGRIEELMPPNSRATGINEQGVVTGTWDDQSDGKTHPFVWSAAAGSRMLDASDADHGYGLAVNDAGQVVGGLARVLNNLTTFVATRWRRIGRITAVHRHSTLALSVNNVGRAVGYAMVVDANGGITAYHPFLWRLGRIIKLPLGRNTDGIAYDINNGAEVAGSVWSGGGSATAVLWRVHE